MKIKHAFNNKIDQNSKGQANSKVIVSNITYSPGSRGEMLNGIPGGP